MEKKYYLYVYLNPLKKGSFNFGDYHFEYEPFYIGKGLVGSKRKTNHLHYVKNLNKDLTNNRYKFNIIKQILNEGLEPLIYEIITDLTEIDAFNLEKLLIQLIGFRFNHSGLLTNISSGGDGSDTFTNNPNKEIIREKHRFNAIGDKNNMYGIPLEQRPSHIAKIKGNHWNTGRKATLETKEKMKLRDFTHQFKKVVKVDENGNDLETYDSIILASLDNNIKNKSSISRSCKSGGKSGGYRWRYFDSELVIVKEKVTIKKEPKMLKVFFKHNFTDKEEIEFKSVVEASNNTNFCVEVIRRKCRLNNTEKNVFRYESSDYKIKIKKGVSRKIKLINNDGSEVLFESITEAARLTNGNTSSIFAVCVGRNKTYKGVKYEYL
jgi:hypothetical protein